VELVLVEVVLELGRMAPNAGFPRWVRLHVFVFLPEQIDIVVLIQTD
jgi:hypothetical protein